MQEEEENKAYTDEAEKIIEVEEKVKAENKAKKQKAIDTGEPEEPPVPELNRYDGHRHWDADPRGVRDFADGSGRVGGINNRMQIKSLKTA